MNLFNKISNKVNIAWLRARGSLIGESCLLAPGVDINRPRGLIMGAHCALYKNVTVSIGLSGMFKMGSNSHSAPYGYYLVGEQRLMIGSDVAIGPFCSFFCLTNSLPSAGGLFRKSYSSGDIVIGDNVFIGAHCVLLPGTEIGDNTVIAANSVIGGRLDAGCLYGGSPVKKIKVLEQF